MQSKGAIKLVAALVAVACIWQLSFTAVTKIQEKKASKYADAAVAAFQQTPAWSKVAAEDQAYVLDSLAKDRNRWYTDSVSAEKVYFGYTYKDVKSKEINLGLDLKNKKENNENVKSRPRPQGRYERDASGPAQRPCEGTCRREQDS